MIIIRGYHNCQPMLVLKKDVFEVEYGHPISQNPLDYVKINEYKEKKKGPPLKKTKLKLNLSLDEENGYPPVGEYNATIQYATEDKISFKIIKPAAFYIFATISYICHITFFHQLPWSCDSF